MDNQQASQERRCRVCERVKNLEDFAIVYAKNSRGVNYRQHTCQECSRAKLRIKEAKRRKDKSAEINSRRRELWHLNKEKMKAQKRASDKRLKNLVFEAYGGYECTCCGETEETMLTIDHIDENGAAHRREVSNNTAKYRITADIYRWLKKNGFPEGFQVLCYNCNVSKHRNGGVCSHKLLEASTTIPRGSTPKRVEAQGILNKDDDIV